MKNIYYGAEMGWVNQWMHCNLYCFKIFCNYYLIVPKPLIVMKRQNRIKHESTNISCKTYGESQRWPCEDFVTGWIVFFIFFSSKSISCRTVRHLYWFLQKILVKSKLSSSKNSNNGKYLARVSFLTLFCSSFFEMQSSLLVQV
jgi:hypothetical protein